MSEIITYDNNLIREFSIALKASYEAKQTIALPFREWQDNAFTLMANNPKANNISPIKEGQLIRVAPSTKEMLRILEEHHKEFEDIELHTPQERKDYEITQLARQLIKPASEFEYHPFFFESEGRKHPIWFNTTLKGINLRYGYLSGDSSTPAFLSLDDDRVHTMLGGATGQGKSVALHTVILNLLLEYAPWELMMFLADFKIAELSKYANRIQTPHCNMIAATESSEFVMSFYDEIVSEMNRRQALFSKLGVEKLSNLRSKLNMVIPRAILIVDEFVQQRVNILKSEAKGNDNASEDLKVMNTKIGELARLGRSMGMHMLFSSQSLEGALESQTEGQFSSGAALKGQKSVSTSLIGNDAAAYIKGKGKIFVNPNKAAKDPTDNQFVRVPFMKTDQSEEEQARGDLTELLVILKELNRNAELVGYINTPYYYNEKDILPFPLFEGAKEYAKGYITNPTDIADPVDRQIFLNDIAFVCPLGKPIRYNTTPSELLCLKRLKRNNIIISAIDKSDLNYMVMILKSGLMLTKHQAFIVAASKSLYLGAHLNEYPDATVSERAVMPDSIMSKFNSRRLLLDTQESIIDSTGKLWDDLTCVKYFVKRDQNPRYPIKASPEAIADWAVRSRTTNTKPADFESEITALDKENAILIVNVILNVNSVYASIQQITNFERRLTPDMFPALVTWWVGLDEIDAVVGDRKHEFASYLDRSCQVNMFNIIMASVWSKVGYTAENCDYILEKCAKDFFIDLSIPRSINVNEHSFQLIQQSLKHKVIIAMYTV